MKTDYQKGKLEAIAFTRQDSGYSPPVDVRNEAKRGLEIRRNANKSDRGGLSNQEASKEGIGSGVQRAVNLANGDNLSLETIKRMKSFFARHRGNYEKAKAKNLRPEESKAIQAWLLWGGDAGDKWVNSILEKNDSYVQGRLDAIRSLRLQKNSVTNKRLERAKLNKGKCPKGKHWVQPTNGRKGFCRKGGNLESELPSEIKELPDTDQEKEKKEKLKKQKERDRLIGNLLVGGMGLAAANDIYNAYQVYEYNKKVNEVNQQRQNYWKERWNQTRQSYAQGGGGYTGNQEPIIEPPSKQDYDLLGINKNASPKEAKVAYHKMAMKYHPDRNPNDPEAEVKFKEINLAYERITGEKGKGRNPRGDSLSYYKGFFDINIIFGF